MAQPLTIQDQIAALKAQKCSDIRGYFGGKWLKNKNGTMKVSLGNVDRDAIRAFLLEPPTTDYNPGGPDFEGILTDTKDEIDNGTDDARLLLNLLLVYKAVRRG
jgi:hypothetical protein